MVRSYRRSTSSAASRRRRERRLLHSSSTSSVKNNEDAAFQQDQDHPQATAPKEDAPETDEINPSPSSESSTTMAITTTTTTNTSSGNKNSGNAIVHDDEVAASDSSSVPPNNETALIEEIAAVGCVSSNTSSPCESNNDPNPSNGHDLPSSSFSEATTVIVDNKNDCDQNNTKGNISMSKSMSTEVLEPCNEVTDDSNIACATNKSEPPTSIRTTVDATFKQSADVPTPEDDVEAEIDRAYDDDVEAELNEDQEDGREVKNAQQEKEGDLFGNLWGFLIETTGNLAQGAMDVAMSTTSTLAHETLKITVATAQNVWEHPVTHQLVQHATSTVVQVWEHPLVATQRQHVLQHASSVIVPLVAAQHPLVDQICQTSINFTMQHILPVVDGLLQGHNGSSLTNSQGCAIPALPPLTTIPETEEETDLSLKEEVGSTTLRSAVDKNCVISYYIRCDDIPMLRTRKAKEESQDGSAQNGAIPRRDSPLSVLDIDTENKNTMNLSSNEQPNEMKRTEDDEKSSEVALSNEAYRVDVLMKYLVVRSNHSPSELLSPSQTFNVSLDLDCLLDALCHRALNYCSLDEQQQLYNYIEWEADPSTKKTLDKQSTHSLEDEKTLLLWMGKLVETTTGGSEEEGNVQYGNGIALFKARGIINGLSSKQLLDLLWSNDNVHKYNRWIVDRQNLAEEESKENVSASLERKTKIVRSTSKLPFTNQHMVLTNLMHARCLDDSHGIYLIVTRSVTVDPSKEQGNEVIFGVNYIRPCGGTKDNESINGHNSCEMVAISQMRANFAPNFLKTKVGFTGLTQFFNELRSHAASITMRTDNN